MLLSTITDGISPIYDVTVYGRQAVGYFCGALDVPEPSAALSAFQAFLHCCFCGGSGHGFTAGSQPKEGPNVASGCILNNTRKPKIEIRNCDSEIGTGGPVQSGFARIGRFAPMRAPGKMGSPVARMTKEVL